MSRCQRLRRSVQRQVHRVRYMYAVDWKPYYFGDAIFDIAAKGAMLAKSIQYPYVLTSRQPPGRVSNPEHRIINDLDFVSGHLL